MTRLSVDDQIADFKWDASQRVADVLNAVLSSLPPNRMVTDIILDGKLLSKAYEPLLLDKGVEHFNEVQIRTADKEIWAATGLDIALSCLERVQRSLIRAAELFREDNQAKANSFFCPMRRRPRALLRGRSPLPQRPQTRLRLIGDGGRHA